MKAIKIKSAVFITLVLISACSNNHTTTKAETEKEKNPENIITNTDSVVQITVTSNLLAGIWKYSEVRTNPKLSGTPPIGEILLGITEDKVLSFATHGEKELEENLKLIPTNFEIKGNTLVPKDKLSEGDFKINFNNTLVPVYLLTENELILGKGKLEKNIPVLYMYFKKVK